MASPFLRRRIEALEARYASGGTLPPMHPVARALNVLVAYHLGGAGPSDSIEEAMARGLGSSDAREFSAALMARSDGSTADDLDTRWRDAMVHLFALKGAAPECDGSAFRMVVEALFAEMPERLRQHPFHDRVWTQSA